MERTNSSVRTTDILIMAAGIALFYCTRVSALSGDSLLAWPITDKLLRPDYYGNNDLIVNAGISGNYLFYELLALLPFLNENFPLRDFLLYIPIFLLYVGAWFLVFREISGNARLSAVAILLFLLSDMKLGLNWSIAPNPSLLSGTSVQFLQVFAFLLFLLKKRVFSYVLLGITSLFHPSSALVFFSIFAAIALVDFYHLRQRRMLLHILFGSLFFIPTIVMILSHSQGAFDLSKQEYFSIFSSFQFHAYLEDHFKMGYAYTISLMVVLHLLFKANYLRINHSQEIHLLFAVSVLGSVLWLMNLYIFENLQFIQTYFITRAFYLLKPLLVLFTLLLGSTIFRNRMYLLDTAVACSLCMTVFTLSPTLSLVIVVSTAGYIVQRRVGILLFISLLTLYIGLIVYYFPPHMISGVLRADIAGNHFVPFELFILVIVLSPMVMYTYQQPVSRSALASRALQLNSGLFYWTLVILLILATNLPVKLKNMAKQIAAFHTIYFLSSQDNYGYNVFNADYGRLLDWAKKSSGNMFVVPPYDSTFLSFRYITKNGVYVLQSDINQLSYSPGYYSVGYSRLLQTGLRPGSGNKYDRQWTYNDLPIKQLRAISADFIIYDKKTAANRQTGKIDPVYENDSYVVYALKDI